MPDRSTLTSVRNAARVLRAFSRAGQELGITVSYWASVADARAWKKVTEHLAAQQTGRERWYRGYRVRIATVEREYGF